MPSEISAVLRLEGLRSAPIDGLATRLEAAEKLLAEVPDLASVVSRTVGAIHPLEAKPEFDVSHSQPKWRERIFVSFPERQDEIGTLRLTESVVHEAMHLHLTNEEARIAFVARTMDALYSPWRDTIRSVSGVMHGLFVFSCISAFLLRLTETVDLPDDASRYVNRRIADIRRQISKVDSVALEGALTPHGISQARFWKKASLIRRQSQASTS